MDDELRWFGPTSEFGRLEAAGFKIGTGGPHQSKTMMLDDLRMTFGAANAVTPEGLIIDQNILGKRTARSRQVALYRLNQLYGLTHPPPVCAALAGLWSRDISAQPLLAVLCALARDPSLRDASPAVLDAPIGTQVRWPAFGAAIEARRPGRLGTKMLKSLAQNCASTWSQAGFLRGKLAKVRVHPTPTPTVAAYAALLSEYSGFGGPALVASPWLAVTDVPIPERIVLLREADALGLLRLRTGGGIVEIVVRERMAAALGLPELGNI